MNQKRIRLKGKKYNLNLKQVREEFDTQPLFRRIRRAIYKDDYLWIVIHGPPRCSKSTLALWLTWYIYDEWLKCMQATTFNLQGIMYRIIKGIPERWLTENRLHNRVPLLLFDDFGVHSNKADTQHSTAWDIFKGGFDALGTEIGILLATMVKAEEPTSQLQDKYNIEVTVDRKGHYKYDDVVWLQDYRGFRSKMRKRFIDHSFFPKLPASWYIEYDQERKGLTKQVFVRIQDALSIDSMDLVLKMIQDSDIQLIKMIIENGPVYYQKAKEELKGLYKETLTRCQARNLIVSNTIDKHNYKIDVTPLALDVISALKNKEQARKKSIYKKDHTYTRI